MKKRILALLLFITVSETYACGGDGEEYFYMDIFSQEMIGDESLHPFLLSYYSYYNDHLEKDVTEINIIAYEELLRGKFSKEDIKAAVYNSTAEDYSEIHQALVYKDRSKLVKWKDNKLMQSFIAGRNKALLNYLTYAKQCEVLANIRSSYYNWYSDNDDVLDTSAFKNAIENGKLQFNSEENLELKTRYGFQVVRLSHYIGDYEFSKQFFESKMLPIASNRYIYFRALEQYAGALNGLGDFDYAAYLFSKVFHELPDRRKSCVNSLKFNKGEFDAAFKLCQSDGERATMYAMRAYQKGGYHLEEMENIFTVDQSSAYLELFLARQIKLYERSMLNLNTSWGNSSKEPVFIDYGDEQDLKRMMQLVDEIIPSVQKERKEFWLISRGYLDFLNEDYAACISSLNAIETKHYEDQKNLILHLSQLLKHDTITSELEDILFVQNQSMPSEFQGLLMHVLRVRYFNQDEIAKAFLSTRPFESVQENLSFQMLDLLEGFLHVTPSSSIERKLQSQININQINEARGTYFFQNGYLDSAIYYYRLVEENSGVLNAESNSSYIVNDLFRASIKHYFSEDFSWQSKDVEFSFEDLDIGIGSSKLDLAEGMMQMKRIADENKIKNPELSSELLYSIGTAWNNLSPYGYYRPVLFYGGDNCCNSYIYGVSSEEHFVVDGKFFFRKYDRGWHKMYKPSIAIASLEEALSLTTNNELKAKILFKLAEAALYGSYGDQGDYNEVPEPSEYYEQLKKLSHTAYYAEVLQECGYFRSFIAQ